MIILNLKYTFTLYVHVNIRNQKPINYTAFHLETYTYYTMKVMRSSTDRMSDCCFKAK
jgi:hypothetical protein